MKCVACRVGGDVGYRGSANRQRRYPNDLAEISQQRAPWPVSRSTSRSMSAEGPCTDVHSFDGMERTDPLHLYNRGAEYGRRLFQAHREEFAQTCWYG